MHIEIKKGIPIEISLCSIPIFYHLKSQAALGSRVAEASFSLIQLI